MMFFLSRFVIERRKSQAGVKAAYAWSTREAFRLSGAGRTIAETAHLPIKAVYNGNKTGKGSDVSENATASSRISTESVLLNLFVHPKLLNFLSFTYFVQNSISITSPVAIFRIEIVGKKNRPSILIRQLPCRDQISQIIGTENCLIIKT